MKNPGTPYRLEMRADSLSLNEKVSHLSTSTSRGVFHAVSGPIHCPHGDTWSAQAELIHVRGDLTREAQGTENSTETWVQGEITEKSVKTLRRLTESHLFQGLPGQLRGKEPACQCRRHKRYGSDHWVGKIPWRRARQPTPVFLPGESHGWRSLAGYSPWSCKVEHNWAYCLQENTYSGNGLNGHLVKTMGSPGSLCLASRSRTHWGYLLVMCQVRFNCKMPALPGWEGILGENGCMYTYGWVPLLFTWKLSQHWLLIGYTPIQNKKFRKNIALKKLLTSPLTTLTH